MESLDPIPGAAERKKMYVRNGKVFISQRNMNRMYHGTHQVWEVLRNEGAELLVSAVGPGGKRATVRLPRDQRPMGPIVGVSIPEIGDVIVLSWSKRFRVTDVNAHEDFAVKELRIEGMPTILVETPEMTNARLGA